MRMGMTSGVACHPDPELVILNAVKDLLLFFKSLKQQ